MSLPVILKLSVDLNEHIASNDPAHEDQIRRAVLNLTTSITGQDEPDLEPPESRRRGCQDRLNMENVSDKQIKSWTR